MEQLIEEIIVKDKQKYLDEHFHIAEVPKITDKMLCIHCEKVFTVGDYKVFKDRYGDEFICCPNAPGCDGTIIDWFPPDFEY